MFRNAYSRYRGYRYSLYHGNHASVIKAAAMVGAMTMISSLFVYDDIDNIDGSSTRSKVYKRILGNTHQLAHCAADTGASNNNNIYQQQNDKMKNGSGNSNNSNSNSSNGNSSYQQQQISRKSLSNNQAKGKDRVGLGEVYAVTQYSANEPIEDRYKVEHLDIGAWWFACFDGHGGWQCSEYVHKELHNNISVELQNRLGLGHEENNMFGQGQDAGDASEEGVGIFEGKINERLVRDSLVAGFERTDRIYKTKVMGAFEVGFGRDTRAGSCALGALFVDGIMFVANLGDCRAVLAAKLPDEKKMKSNDTQSTTAAASQVANPASLQDNTKDNEPSFHEMVDRALIEAAVRRSQGGSVDAQTEAALRRLLKKEVERQNIPDDDDFDTSGKDQRDMDLGPDDNQHSPILETAIDDPKKKKKEKSDESALVSVVRFFTGKQEGMAEAKASPTSTIFGSDATETPVISSDYVAVQVTNDHNAREKREQRKLQAEHPDEDDVIVCKPNRPDICYIKGKLQPTRAFGDYYLKYSEFMRSPAQHSSAGRYIMPPYTPPYITSTPDISTLRLRRNIDDFMIIATDGVWDYVSNQEAVDIVAKNLRSNGGSLIQATDALKLYVLEKAASKNNMSLEQLIELPQGRDRRRRHDDLTIVSYCYCL